MRWLAYDVPVSHPLFSKTVRCNCEKARAAAQALIKYDLNIGEYEHMTFAAYEGRSPEQRRSKIVLEALVKAWQNGGTNGAILFGGVGQGKTHLSIAALRAAAQRGLSVATWTMPNLFDELIEAYGGKDGEAAKLRRIWETVDVLLLDDVGAEKRKGEWVERVYFAIIDVRYTRHLRTLVTTNLDMNALETYLGQRTADRLTVLCNQPLDLGAGKSYRQLQIEKGI